MNKTLYNKSILVGITLLLLIASHITFAQSAPSLSEIANYDGLHEAAHLGDVDRILQLLKAGADIEAQDTSGRTPLLVAAFASHDDCVEALAKAGANLNALENRAYDIVTIAAVADDLAMLDLALALGANPGNITSPYDGTALIAAAHLGHHAVVNSLIKAKAPLDHVNNLKWTALIEAVVLGDGGADHTETVRLLVNAGANKNIGDSEGVTPLEHAKSRGYQDMVQLLSAGP